MGLLANARSALSEKTESSLHEFKLVRHGLAQTFKPGNLVQMGLACFAVWLCAPQRLSLSWSAALQVIVFGVIFPMTHAITENFKRREAANQLLSQLYASCTAIYWAHVDWPNVVLGEPAGKVGTIENSGTNVASVLHDFLCNVRLLMTPDTREETFEAAYHRCMKSLRTVNFMNDTLGRQLGFAKGGEGGISRLYQYVRYLMANIQDLRNMREYSGTPHGLRFFCAVMVYVSPLMLAPYWRSFCADQDAAFLKSVDRRDPGCAAGYFNAVLYVIVLSTLYAVTMGIEDLWDGDGFDDVCFTLDLRWEEATRQEARHEVLNGKIQIEYSDALGTEPSVYLQGDAEGRCYPSTHLVHTRAVIQPHESPLIRSYSNRLPVHLIPKFADEEAAVESHYPASA